MSSSKISFILIEFRPNSDLKSSNGSIPRRLNLSTKVEEDEGGHPQARALLRALRAPGPPHEARAPGAARGHRRRLSFV